MMTRSTLKTSTIFVAIGGETNVYRSLHEMPAGVKRKLRESSRAWNSATIMIADRRGRDELVRAMEGQPSRIESRLVRSGAARRLITSRAAGAAKPQSPVKDSFPVGWRRWAEMAVLASTGVALWLLFLNR